MLMRRRDFLCATAAGFLVSKAGAGAVLAPALGDELAFVAIGDWGNPGHHDAAVRVAQAMAETGREANVQFVLAVGDNFYPRGVSSAEDPVWTTVFEKTYSREALDVPWYAVLGNHDHKGNSQAQIDYTSRSPRWNMPKPYYTLHRELSGVAADFFFIDTTPIADARWWRTVVWSDPSVTEQLRWLEQELQRSTARWKIVIGHHPVYSGGSHGSTKALVDLLPPLFERYGVQLYINGHDLQHIKRAGISYVTSGAAANTREVQPIDGTLFSAAKLGFLLVRLSPVTATLTFIGDRSETLYETMIATRA
ncbi:Acid phosphatase [Pseudorhizobium banfieldiae]|uniref:acid phosphatase n=1 Tax=Pseudorhizobium banfieldiae TaxID=1125847 RepID=L0NBC5_9HYPH|nr:tartrate-resistant acid phosphatase type 5 family protein [Pseudorhizobium banfieldiae]CAD6602147.1 3',5'-cyclic adenosine monophosphate phosphodiesterase CpdA [arsenite-oxidising bacterium NT-25]CCF18375.1 Acid phosphatase [Pseudorhizobium banfieldiae]